MSDSSAVWSNGTPVSDFMESGDASILTGKSVGAFSSDSAPNTLAPLPHGIGTQQSTSLLSVIGGAIGKIFGVQSSAPEYNRTPTDSDDIGGLAKRTPDIAATGSKLVFYGFLTMIAFFIFVAWRRFKS